MLLLRPGENAAKTSGPHVLRPGRDYVCRASANSALAVRERLVGAPHRRRTVLPFEATDDEMAPPHLLEVPREEDVDGRSRGRPEDRQGLRRHLLRNLDAEARGDPSDVAD